MKAELARLQKALEDLKRRIEAAIEANPRLADYKRQIKLEMTPEAR